METVDFYPKKFQDIPKQDNPAFGYEECLMIVGEQKSIWTVVLHIVPDPKGLKGHPKFIESVNSLAKFLDHSRAVEYCKIFEP